ncbi:BTB/POZ domain-containing protein At2g13690-like [Ananas comosus]|uniref:BTB/POZ domain-containing protein At2g13690-like n=1 Tax=Ananas comosus TaxID=4615 RepID=A0A6P5GFF4_ANACO|nr:BTB/POZ domain-containing protein At2g13690-like [Ananas comosus]
MATSAADHGRRKPGHHLPAIRPTWCCSFGVDLHSTELRPAGAPHRPKPPSAAAASSHGGSPSPGSKIGLGLIASRRMLSPGRVSPIDSEPPVVEFDSEPLDPSAKERRLSSVAESKDGASSREKVTDVKMRLMGRDGDCLVLELDAQVLCKHSSVFARMVAGSRKKVSDGEAHSPMIEVSGLRDFRVFKDTIELMYEKDAMKWLMNAGVSRAIEILEVSFSIMFDRGATTCLKYLGAVPWNESEEEKLQSLFARCTFDEAVSQDILARLYPQEPTLSGDLALKLIQSISNGTNNNARKELQSLVNGILSTSSIYQKDTAGLNKESVYNICYSCLNSLVELFKEASGKITMDQKAAVKEEKPLVERIARQVENLNWQLGLLIDKQMADDFVGLWANQKELVKMHERASPLVRYELSRISATLFMGMGSGKLHCNGEKRLSMFDAWFRPLLKDFSWLRRCPKGLDMRVLEETLGQALLTLTLKEQHSLFMVWFEVFSGQGKECPNLSNAFQVWWRRSFSRAADHS